MNTTVITHRPVVGEFYRLLMALDDLDVAGLNDSDEADDIRDRMDGPWYAMTEVEANIMSELSASLNDLRPGRPKFEPMDEATLAAYRSEMAAAREAGRNGRPDVASAALRRTHPAGVGITPGMIRYMQGYLWLDYGLPEAAVRLFLAAEREDPRFTMFAMNLLRRLGRDSEAVARAERLCRDAGDDPEALYFAGAVLFEAARRARSSPDESMTRRAVESLRRALNLVESDRGHEVKQPRIIAAIASLLACCLEALKDYPAAVKVCERALKLVPNDAEAWASYGTALAGSGRRFAAQAAAAFQRAIELGTQASDAYVWYAWLVVENQPAEAVEAVNKAFERILDLPDKVAAALYHLRGIGLARLGRPLVRVIEDYDRALGHDPDNDQIIEYRRAAAAAREDGKQSYRPAASEVGNFDRTRFQAIDRQYGDIQQGYLTAHTLELLPAG